MARLGHHWPECLTLVCMHVCTHTCVWKRKKEESLSNQCDSIHRCFFKYSSLHNNNNQKMYKHNTIHLTGLVLRTNNKWPGVSVCACVNRTRCMHLCERNSVCTCVQLKPCMCMGIGIPYLGMLPLGDAYARIRSPYLGIDWTGARVIKLSSLRHVYFYYYW